MWSLRRILSRMHTTDRLNTALQGRYAIESLVGEGGMATVYLARDLKHNRRVAVKVLKPDLGAVVGVDRFLSEIEVTANLQHPNLLPLFDSGSADGLLFYVMPFVDGESLRQRIEREKQLPVDEAVRITTAVASALDYAHARGVIHRDLKPENILLQHGQPIVADFGIALAVSNAGGNRITQTGLSLGTPQYMSPEQATGDRIIDARTDIYSLGAVAYEMLTGDPPHVGSSSQAIIARLLTERPRSMRAVRPSVPLHVEAAVDRALEKLPADRIASAKEFADALNGKVILASTVQTSAASRVPPINSTRQRVIAGALVVVALAVGAFASAFVRANKPPAALQQVRFTIDARPANNIQLSVSPDGSHIVYPQRDSANVGYLMIRPLGANTATRVNGSEGAGPSVFWSPDSRYFGWVADGKMIRVARDGSGRETMGDVGARSAGVTWGSKDVLVYTALGELFRVTINGGTPTKILLTGTDVRGWAHPWFLPDGEHFLVMGGRQGVFVASINGGTPVHLMSSATRVVFAAPDQVLFVRDDALYAQTLDLRHLKLTGDPIRIGDDVSANPNNMLVGFASSNNGVLVIRHLNGLSDSAQLKWYSRAGTPQATVLETGAISEIALSPDGKYVAMTRAGLSGQVWLLDLATHVTSQLTNGDKSASGVLWTPDSRAVTYLGHSPSGADTVYTRVVGSAIDSVVYTSTSLTRAEDYTADGKTLVLREPADGRIIARDAGSSATRALATLGRVDEIRVSPDGRFVSWNSTGNAASDDWQVWVASYPSFANRRQVSPAGGRQARWRGDSKEIFFLTPDGSLMSAMVVPGPVPEFRAPTLLFRNAIPRPSAVSDQYDVSRDGQRVLLTVYPTWNSYLREQPPLAVVVNWTSMLHRK